MISKNALVCIFNIFHEKLKHFHFVIIVIAVASWHRGGLVTGSDPRDASAETTSSLNKNTFTV